MQRERQRERDASFEGEESSGENEALNAGKKWT
jgi:hypothetical protein